MESPAMIEEGGSRGSEKTLERTALPILGFVLGLAAFLGLVLVGLPQLLRNWTESQLSSVIAHKVEIEHLNLNILSGDITLDVLHVRSPEDHSELAVIRQVNADVDVPALFNRELSLKRLEMVSPVVHLVRTEDLSWNFSTMGERRAPSHSKARISVTIGQAVLRDGSLTVEDRGASPARIQHMHDIQVTLTDFALASSGLAKIHGSARISESGVLAIDGAILSDLRSGNMQVDLTDLALTALQGYVNGHLRVKGHMNAHLSVTWPGKGKSPVGVSGALEGYDIALSSSGRPMGHTAMVSVPQFEIMWPDRVAVDQLVVNKPEIWVHRNETGRFVGFRTEEHNSPKPRPTSSSNDRQSEAATTSPQWLIAKIIVRGGTVHLEDRSVSPAYSDSLQNLELALDDFMLAPDHAVMITARTDIASGGALALHGRAALFGPTPTVSLKATIHRMVVPSTNPYLERTVSHYTTDGTLTSAMDIRLIGDRLEVISDVTLSDLQVEPLRNSTTRTVQERIGLPLGLLVALLKDDAGRIVITFPVSGPLSNPTFDWTNAIWTTIRNAVVKIITLPIRSIGRFFMGDHQADELPLDPITFDPGSSTIRPEMQQALHDLAKLLRSTNRAVLHITPILSPTDLKALQGLPPESWPIPSLDRPETAGHVLAVRRAYIVAAGLAGQAKVPSARLPVDPPQPDTSERGQPRVELQLEKGDRANATSHALSERER